MHFYATERIALFIDGANCMPRRSRLALTSTSSACWPCSPKRHGSSARFITPHLSRTKNFPLRPLVDWLTYNAFTVVTKPAKTFTDVEGRRKLKGNMDVELAVDAMRLALTSITSCCSQATGISAV